MKYRIPMCKHYYFATKPHCRKDTSNWATLKCHSVNKSCPDYEPSETNIDPSANTGSLLNGGNVT